MTFCLQICGGTLTAISVVLLYRVSEKSNWCVFFGFVICIDSHAHFRISVLHICFESAAFKSSLYKGPCVASHNTLTTSCSLLACP